MQRVTLMAAVLLAACGSDDDEGPGETGEHTWSYEGEAGPDHWGDIDGFMTCDDGESQSPIALMSGLSAEDLPDIELEYESSGVTIVNNGHTVQYDYDPGSVLRIGEAEYELLQFHFHAPSEHTLDGEAFPMELHLVHRSDEGDYAVLGVFIREGDRSEMLVDAQWSQLPQEQDGVHVDEDAMFNAFELVPEGDNSYRYPGSLTTPPCTEGLAWNVFATPITLSSEQIERFTDIHTGNFRPLQGLEERSVVFGR